MDLCLVLRTSQESADSSERGGWGFMVWRLQSGHSIPWRVFLLRGHYWRRHVIVPIQQKPPHPWTLIARQKASDLNPKRLDSWTRLNVKTELLAVTCCDKCWEAFPDPAKPQRIQLFGSFLVESESPATEEAPPCTRGFVRLLLDFFLFFRPPYVCCNGGRKPRCLPFFPFSLAILFFLSGKS